MNQKEIIETIEDIKKQVSADSCRIIENKIKERTFHIFKPNRFAFFDKIIQKIRRRLAIEVEHILRPVLDTQKEINLRFLKEIEDIKQSIASDQSKQHDKKNQKNNQTDN